MNQKQIFLLVFFVSHTAFCQKALEMLPDSAYMVSFFNLENYAQKHSTENLRQLHAYNKISHWFHDKSQDDIFEALLNQDSVGIDWYKNTYLFAQNVDSLELIGYVFPIKNFEQFEDFIKNYVENSGTEIEKKGLYQFYCLENEALAFTKQNAVLLFAKGNEEKISESSSENSSENLEQMLASYARLQSHKKAVLTQKIDDIFAKKTKNLLQNENFRLFSQKKFDVGVWFNLLEFDASLTKMINELDTTQSSSVSGEAINRIFQNFLESGYVHLLFEVEKGTINAQIQQYVSPDLSKSLEGLYVKRANTSYFDYFSDDKLVAFGSVATDLQKSHNAIWDFVKNALSVVPEYAQQAQSLADMVDIVVDQDALFKIFRGDLMFAISEFREMELSSISYEYDDDFNMTEVKKTVVKEFPVIVFLFSGENPELFDRFMKSYLILGGLQKKEGTNYYEIPQNSLSLPNFYLLIENNLALFTNDEKVVKKEHKNKNIRESTKNLLKEHSQVYFLDVKNLFSFLSKSFQRDAQKQEDEEKAEDLIESSNQSKILSESIDNISLTGIDFQKNVLSYRLQFFFQDKTKSGLELLLDLFSDESF